MRENGYTYPVLMDTTGEVFMQYGISAYPTTFMVDKDGNLFGYVQGAVKRRYDAQHYPADDGRQERVGEKQWRYMKWKMRKNASILVGVQENDAEPEEESLDELAELARTAGAEVAGRLIQKREAMHPVTYIGKGKILELKELLWETDATGIICDDELTSVQLNHLEEELECKIVDRTLLILDIFRRKGSQQRR